MASSKNKGKGKYFFYAIIALLIVSLAGFGTLGLQGAPIYSVGKIGEKDISVRDYTAAWTQVSTELARQRQRALTPADYQDVQDIALQRLFFEGALDSKVKDMGISISDTALATLIVNDARYTGLDGKFDKEFYDTSLESQAITPRENEALVRDQQVRALLEDTIQTGLTEATNQPLILLEYTLQRRDFNWIALNRDSVAGDLVEPTDAQLMTYYQDNSQNYQAPLVRKISYVWLSPEMLQAGIEVSEDELRNSYELQDTRFNRPGVRNIDRIVFADAEAAAAARTGLDAQTLEFEDIAAERGLSEADIRLGAINQQGLGTVSEQAAEAIFASDDTGIFGPYASSLGPAIYRVNSITGARNTSFEDARDELIAEIAGDEARRLIADSVLDLEDQLAAGNTIEELAATSDLEFDTLDFMQDTRVGIAAHAEFREEAASARPNDFPRLIELRDGGIFALRVDEIIAERVLPFEEVRTQVANDFRAAETARLLQELGDELLSRLEKGEAMDTLGYDVTTESEVLRSQPNLPLPEGFLADIFTLENGAARSAQDGGTLYIAQLSAIYPADPTSEDNQEFLAQFETQIRQQRAADIREAFIRAIQQDVGLALDNTALGFINTQLLSFY